MNGRVAKKLRRENDLGIVKPTRDPEMHWGPNRKQKRQKYVDRTYTKKPTRKFKKEHVVNDYRFQRDGVDDI